MERREFLRASVLGSAALAAPVSFVQAAAPEGGKDKQGSTANGKVNLGFIGLGQQAMYLLSTFMAFDDVHVPLSTILPRSCGTTVSATSSCSSMPL